LALSHLLDTSVLTRLARPPVRTVVDGLVRAGRLARARISDLEIGFSARDVGEWDRLMGSLAIFPVVETTDAHLRRACGIQRQLAIQRQRGRKVPDLLVAAAAEDRGLVVLHYDSDFDLIAAVTGQPCQWVVPAGSID
jgi:predicted nucleic acid-binding protein